MDLEWTMKSSRQRLGAPVRHAQQGSDRTLRAPACQGTRRARLLGENDSRGPVGAVNGERVDMGHHGEEHRGGENGCRHSQHRTQDRADRAARSAGTALMLTGMADLERRHRGRQGRRVSIRRRHSHNLRMLVILRGCAVVVCVMGQCHRLHLHGCTAAVVTWTAKRHGRGCGTLRGNCQHQHPYQQHSDPQTHSSILTRSCGLVPRLVPPGTAQALGRFPSLCMRVTMKSAACVM